MCSLLIYRNPIDFCMFILYSATLLNSLVRGFLDSLRFLCRQSCHLQIGTVLFLSSNLPDCYFLFCFTVPAGTSSTTSNKSGESKLALFPKIKEKASPFSIMLALKFFIDALYQVEEVPSHSYFF